MPKDELLALLKEHLTIGLDFYTYTYSGNNQLEVQIKFDGEVIASESVRLDITSEKSYY